MSLFGAKPLVPSATTVPDVEVALPPSDSVSSLAFSPQADYLAVGSWDNSVRVYEVGPNGQTQGKTMHSHQGQVLSVCWSTDGTRLFSGGADNAGRMLDMQTGQSQQVAQHEMAVKSVRWADTPQGSFLITGSWDKTIKYWDIRQPNPIATVQLPERCYTLDVMYPLLAVGCAERKVEIINLANPTATFKSIISPLKQQTRVVTCFPRANGFAIGSVEGRVAMQYIEDRDAPNNYSFRCHRQDSKPGLKDQSLVYAVNDINFHPVHGTFSTVGSDGTAHFWDKDARSRLKSLAPAAGPISASCFSQTGALFAYAVSYDWSKGWTGMSAGQVNKIMLHACQEDEVKRRPAKR